MTAQADTSAAGSMLGYLAQVDYALLRSVECLLAGEVHLQIAIEIEDDFSIKPLGSGNVEWWQTKHSVDEDRVLSALDTELWKTLAIWLRHGAATTSVRCFFLTTADCGPDSVLRFLRHAERDEQKAQAGLTTALGDTKSEVVKKHAESWLDMSVEDRVAFLKSVEVVFGAPQADDVSEALRHKMRPFFGPTYVGPGVTYIRGWWSHHVREHLMSFWSDEVSTIDLLELEEQINIIRNRMRDDDLPPALGDAMSVPLADEDARFVQQLRLISLHDERVALCIQDHNQAFLNRSYWQRESLLRVGELAGYDARLKAAWKRHFLPDSNADGSADEEEAALCAKARERFIQLESSDLPRIRAGVREEYIATGSLHVLADRLEIGWHPEWLDRLRSLLDEPSAEEVVA